MADENNAQTPSGDTPHTATGSTPQKTAKVTLVKRIKVPVARPAAPQPEAAPPSQPSEKPEPGEAPAAPEKAAPVPSAEKTDAATPAPAPEESGIAPSDPAIQAEKGLDPVPEPELPPESGKPAVGSPIEAEEIEKEPIRKRRRGSSGRGPQQSRNDAMQEKLQKAKDTTRQLWSNRLVRLGVFAVLFLIIFGSVYAYLPRLAESKLPKLFASNGMPFRSFTMKTLTMDTIELANVSDTSGTMTITGMKAKFSLWNLMMNNELDELEINGLSVTGEKTDEGISLGAVGPLLTAPMRDGAGNELIINRLNIINSRFILNIEEPETPPPPEETEPKLDEFGDPIIEEPEGPPTVNFTANGSLKKNALRLNISTNLENKQLVLRTSSSLVKTPMSAQASVEITEGNVLKDEKTVGSVTGTLNISILKGALESGTADLNLSTPSQDLALKTEVIPGEEGFNLDAQVKRSFKKPEEAFGKFVGDLTIKSSNITMSGNLQKFEGTLPLSLEASSLTNGKVSFQGLASSTELKLACENYNCRYTLTKPFQINMGSLSYGGRYTQMKTYEPLNLVINVAKEPFLTSSNGLLSFRLPLAGFVAKAMVIDNTSSMQTAVAINGARLNAEYNIYTGVYRGNMSFAQSAYVDKNIRLSNMQGMLSFTQQSLPEARFIAGSAVLARKGILPEMKAEMAFHPMKGDEYSVDLSAQMLNGLVSATAKGSYTLASHEWNLYFNLPKLTFSEGGLSLETVFPSLTAYLSPNTSGTIAAKGRMSIRDGRVSGPLNLLLENLSTTWGDIRADGISGVLTLSSLYPFETAINQQIFAGSFNVGIPFRNALFNFRVSPQQGLQVASLRMAFADGQFKTIKPFTVPFESIPAPIYLEGRGINLGVLSQQLKTQSLRMDGMLDSEWKLTLNDRKLTVDRADFQSKMGGLLEFDAPPDVRKTMDKNMQDFLKSVIVKDLLLSMKGPMDGTMQFMLGIRGHSPLDTARKDKEVTLDFSGTLNSFLRQDRGPVNMPSDVLLSLQNFTK